MPPDPLEPSVEHTASLLARIREGDDDARNLLIARYLPALSRLAHGRLPDAVRGQLDTDDLVQSALHRALAGLDRFEYRREGAFLSYLRTVLLNQIRDEARRVVRQRPAGPVPDDLASAARTPLEELVGRETVEAYEAALAELTQDERESVILRIELGLDYAHVAEAVGRPSANAARLLVGRAVVKLAQRMKARGITP